jgi:hypothetical protein
MMDRFSICASGRPRSLSTTFKGGALARISTIKSALRRTLGGNSRNASTAIGFPLQSRFFIISEMPFNQAIQQRQRPSENCGQERTPHLSARTPQRVDRIPATSMRRLPATKGA